MTSRDRLTFVAGSGMLLDTVNNYKGYRYSESANGPSQERFMIVHGNGTPAEMWGYSFSTGSWRILRKATTGRRSGSKVVYLKIGLSGSNNNSVTGCSGGGFIPLAIGLPMKGNPLLPTDNTSDLAVDVKGITAINRLFTYGEVSRDLKQKGPSVKKALSPLSSCRGVQSTLRTADKATVNPFHDVVESILS